MAVIRLYSDNPKDGTTTFDQVEFYEADDSDGSNATLLSTEDIDTSGINPLDSGFTHYLCIFGDTDKYYASKWKQSSSGDKTSYSTWVQGGQDRWDEMFMNELQDTASAVWSSTDRQFFKEKALEALFPELFRIVIDTSLSIDKTSGAEEYTYTVPEGIMEITEVGIGDVDNITTQFKVVHPDNWKFERNLLHFNSLAGFSDDEAIRLVAGKKFMEVGEVPKKYDPLVMDHLRMSAYIKLADDFPRFLKWGKLQKGTKVSFENLRVHAREFERKFREERERLHELMMGALT